MNSDLDLTPGGIQQAMDEFGSMLTPPVQTGIAWSISGIHPCQDLMAADDEQIPWSDQHGVYYFTDSAGHVLYVGSAPVTAFGNRFWDHAEKIKRHDPGWADAAGFSMIRFRAHFYFAAAFEKFILGKTNIPPLNHRR